MQVYIVTEEVTYDYSNGEQRRGIYGVYHTEAAALAAREECLAQVGGTYYAEIEEHEVE